MKLISGIHHSVGFNTITPQSARGRLTTVFHEMVHAHQTEYEGMGTSNANVKRADEEFGEDDSPYELEAEEVAEHLVEIFFKNHRVYCGRGYLRVKEK